MDRSLISEDETHHLLSYTAAVLDHQVQANEYQSTQSMVITSSLSFFSFVSGEYFASFFDDFLKYALISSPRFSLVQLPCQTHYTLQGEAERRPPYSYFPSLSSLSSRASNPVGVYRRPVAPRSVGLCPSSFP